MRSTSLTHLYFESARTSKAWATFLGASVALHLGLVFLPVHDLFPRHENIAFAKGDAGVQVELVLGDASTPSSQENGALPAPDERLVAEIAPQPPVPILKTEEAVFAEPMSPPEGTVSRKSSSLASSHSPTRDHRSQASRAGSAAMQPAAQVVTTQPPYPPGARELGVEGIVRLRVRVGVNGCPRAVEIAHSSGRSDFDNISLATVKREWRFRPARVAVGDPVESTIMVTIRFRINS